LASGMLVEPGHIGEIFRSGHVRVKTHVFGQIAHLALDLQWFSDRIIPQHQCMSRQLGLVRPSSISRVVVLPAPLGPRKPKISPGSTSRLR
jgi:hypothetical protein